MGPFAFLQIALAQTQTTPPGQNAMPAIQQPFTDYTAAAVAWVIVVAFLVSILLIGGFVVINLGMMSKRPEDHIGGRTPSDVGILKNTNWPNEKYIEHALPAEPEEVEAQIEAELKRLEDQEKQARQKKAA